MVNITKRETFLVKQGLERKVIAFSILAALSIILVHAVSVLLRKSLFTAAPAAPYQLIAATIPVLIISFVVAAKNWKFRYLAALIISIVVTALFVLVDRSLLGPMLAVTAVCPLAAVLGNFVVSRLTSRLDGVAVKFPVRSALWVLLALLMITQTARLSSWLVDPVEDWSISTNDPFFAKHMCMTAYVYAADLSRQGIDNVYDVKHYPGLNPDAKVHTTIRNFQPDDPYQYPPQFLLLPRLAIALTDDFDLIKISWFFLQALLFVFISLSVARFIGGEAGAAAALLIPLVWISFPVLSNLQYGQFHMLSILLAVAAMMWFAQGKHQLGGALLAVAILSKVAPAILLVYLLAKRRWKEAGWTVAFCLVISLLALVVIGPRPFEAFINHQLPKIQDGTAFSFIEAWPDYRDLFIAINQSPFAFIFKLDALGIPGMTLKLAKITHFIYTLLVLVIAFFAVRIKGGRHVQLLVWLVLLNLAALVSKGAWGDYIPIGTIWLLTYLLGEMSASPGRKLIMVVTGIFMFLAIGVLPLPGLANPSVFISLAGLGMLLIIGFNLWVLFRARQMSKV
ncbi:MAG: DUF2029 domain-containing protein [bacterium]|nr:DUF2029 domain-containing protein [bacterium]